MMNAIPVRISRNKWIIVISFAMVLLMLLACTLGGRLQSGGQDGGGPLETPTPTPTSVVQEAPITPPTPMSLCGGLNGELEVQVLVGPADAVGLEPYSVGAIPFSATTDEAPYIVSGGGQLEYADMLVEEWGTYEVTLNMDVIVIGECLDTGTGGELQLDVEMAGEQMVEVNAMDFHGEYPWAGTVPMNLVFPLEEGASMEGEGWAFILHLASE